MILTSRFFARCMPDLRHFRTSGSLAFENTCICPPFSFLFLWKIQSVLSSYVVNCRVAAVFAYHGIIFTKRWSFHDQNRTACPLGFRSLSKRRPAFCICGGMHHPAVLCRWGAHRKYPCHKRCLPQGRADSACATGICHPAGGADCQSLLGCGRSKPAVRHSGKSSAAVPAAQRNAHLLRRLFLLWDALSKSHGSAAGRHILRWGFVFLDRLGIAM